MKPPNSPQEAGAAGGRKTPRLVVAALAVSLLALCLLLLITAAPGSWSEAGLLGSFLLAPMGVGLAVVALRRTRRTRDLRGPAIAALVLSAVSFLGFMVVLPEPLSALYLRNPRPRQGECKANLRALVSTQRAYFGRLGTYSADAAQMGFSIEDRNRYAYVWSEYGALAPVHPSEGTATPPLTAGIQVDTQRYPDADSDRLAAAVWQLLAGTLRLGVSGTCPDCRFTAACAAQLDDDSTVDVWVISTQPWTAPGGERVAEGQPFNLVDDVDD